MRYCAILAAVFFTMGLVGCESKTDCEKAVDHILTISGKDPSISRAEREAMAEANNRKSMIDQCNQSFRPAGGVDCVLEAKSLADVDTCRQKMMTK